MLPRDLIPSTIDQIKRIFRNPYPNLLPQGINLFRVSACLEVTCRLSVHIPSRWLPAEDAIAIAICRDIIAIVVCFKSDVIEQNYLALLNSFQKIDFNL